VPQVSNLAHFVRVDPGHSCLALLPPWHIYQRTCSLYILSAGGQLVHTSIRRVRDDLPALKPDHLVAVPLLLDTLHARVSVWWSAHLTAACTFGSCAVVG
jgi:long-chain acyl-CoA synthetase